MRRMTSVFGGSPKAPQGKRRSRPTSSTRLKEFNVCQGAEPCHSIEIFEWHSVLPGPFWLSFGADRHPFLNAGGNPESNTLISDMTTVICLDDYHSLDRNGRKREGVTALDPKAQDFDMMYDQIKALKDRKNADKPIYNHVSGLLDPPETIKPPAVSHIDLF